MFNSELKEKAKKVLEEVYGEIIKEHYPIL